MTDYNINDSFQKLIGEMYIIYRGLRFEKTSAGFIHNGVVCRDFPEMDILVHQHEEALKNSIKKAQ